MTNRENEVSNTTALTWTSSTEWGSVGKTHRATANGWKYVVDQPRKGYWVLRGWDADGNFGLYREDTTMKGAKAQAEAHSVGVKALLDVEDEL